MSPPQNARTPTDRLVDRERQKRWRLPLQIAATREKLERLTQQAEQMGVRA
jgi:hypothetical protein